MCNLMPLLFPSVPPFLFPFSPSALDSIHTCEDVGKEVGQRYLWNVFERCIGCSTAGRKFRLAGTSLGDGMHGATCSTHPALFPANLVHRNMKVSGECGGGWVCGWYMVGQWLMFFFIPFLCSFVLFCCCIVWRYERSRRRNDWCGGKMLLTCF